MRIDSSSVTRCPALTSSGNFCPPTVGTNAGVPAAPTRTSGPTTRFRRLLNAPGKSAPDRVEQSATASDGAAALHHPADRASPAGPNATATVAAKAMHTIAIGRRPIIYPRFTPIDQDRFPCKLGCGPTRTL